MSYILSYSQNSTLCRAVGEKPHGYGDIVISKSKCYLNNTRKTEIAIKKYQKVISFIGMAVFKESHHVPHLGTAVTQNF